MDNKLPSWTSEHQSLRETPQVAKHKNFMPNYLDKPHEIGMSLMPPHFQVFFQKMQSCTYCKQWILMFL